MSQAVRLLVVARDEARATPLCEGLDRLGWRTVTARGAHSAQLVMEDLPVQAALVVAEGLEETDAIARRLREARGERPFPIIGVRARAAPFHEPAAFDLTLGEGCHPSQVALRLEQLVRAAAAEEEFALRRLTFAEHGASVPAPAPDGAPLRVLTVGEPAAKFLALSHALKARGAQATAAFTAYTAFDYLHERAFDAVALWGGDACGEALSIAAGMRRNSRLYHLPTVLYLRSAEEIDSAAAFRRGLTDIATAETPEDETAARLIALARAYRREVAIRRALEQAGGPGLTDPGTGLFTAPLFASHLVRLGREAARTRRPLSVALLRIADRPALAALREGGWFDRAAGQIGSMVARLVRTEDSAGRAGADLFALALPGAGAKAAQAAAERIAAVIGCTAFQAGEGRPAFTVEFDVGSAEIAPGESAVDALERAGARLSAGVPA